MKKGKRDNKPVQKIDKLNAAQEIQSRQIFPPLESLLAKKSCFKNENKCRKRLYLIFFSPKAGNLGLLVASTDFFTRLTLTSAGKGTYHE